MRAITVLCALVVALFGTTTVALAQCTEIHTPKAQLLTPQSRGFVPVAVIFKAPDTETYEPANLVSKYFRFWITGDVALRHDRAGFVREIHRCEFGLPGARIRKTAVKTWYQSVPEESTDGVAGLGSRIMFPVAVVAQHPPVSLMLDSGTEFTGVWGERTSDKGSAIVTLTISPVQ